MKNYDFLAKNCAKWSDEIIAKERTKQLVGVVTIGFWSAFVVDMFV